jgi:hypothetical protein
MDMSLSGWEKLLASHIIVVNPVIMTSQQRSQLSVQALVAKYRPETSLSEQTWSGPMTE